LVSEDEAMKLLPFVDMNIVECIDGCFNQNFYGYLFYVEGMLFYFESKDKADVVFGISSEIIFLPK